MKYESIDEEPAARPDVDYHFWSAVAVVEVFLFLIVLPLLLVYTIYFHDGFAWEAHNTYLTIFNVHPLCMVLGFVVLYSQGALVYRVLRKLPKMVVKLIHAAIMLSVVVCTVVGLLAVFTLHNDNNIANLYSLHSWMGLTTVILFGCQLLAGLMIFLLPFPCITHGQREIAKLWHHKLGFMIYILAALTVLSGLQEKAGFGLGKHNCKVRFANGTCHIEYAYEDKRPEGIVLNLIGLFVGLSMVGVVAIVTETDWRRHSED